MFSQTPAQPPQNQKPVWEIVSEAASRLPDWIHDEVFNTKPSNGVEEQAALQQTPDSSQ